MDVPTAAASFVAGVGNASPNNQVHVDSPETGPLRLDYPEIEASAILVGAEFGNIPDDQLFYVFPTKVVVNMIGPSKSLCCTHLLRIHKLHVDSVQHK